MILFHSSYYCYRLLLYDIPIKFLHTLAWTIFYTGMLLGTVHTCICIWIKLYDIILRRLIWNRAFHSLEREREHAGYYEMLQTRTSKSLHRHSLCSTQKVFTYFYHTYVLVVRVRIRKWFTQLKTRGSDLSFFSSKIFCCKIVLSIKLRYGIVRYHPLL